MSILDSFTSRNEIKLSGSYECDEEFVGLLRDSLDSFSEEHDYSLLEQPSGYGSRFVVEHSTIYGPIPEVKVQSLETEVILGEVYDSIRFEDHSFLSSFGRRSSRKFPNSDMKDLRKEVQSRL